MIPIYFHWWILLFASVLWVAHGLPTRKPVRPYYDVVGNATAQKARPAVRQNCVLHPDNKSVKFFQNTLRMRLVNLFEFKIHMVKYKADPLYSNFTAHYYNPWKWFWTRNQHGNTLLMLSLNYDVLSLSVLRIGVEIININLTDSPEGCFASLTPKDQVELLRALLLTNFGSYVNPYSPSGKIEYGVAVCSTVIRDNGNGQGEFTNVCCEKDERGKKICSDEHDDSWIIILHVALTMVKLTIYCMCPFMLPHTMFSSIYFASEYVCYFKQEIKLKLFISDRKDNSIRYKDRVTKEDIKDWRRFKDSIKELPNDVITPVKVSELRIKVKGKRIITGNDPPSGLIRTLYDNIVRCKIKSLNPFSECCDMSVYSFLEPFVRHKLTWHMFVQFIVKLLMLVFVPLPFYVRLFVYFSYEKNEIMKRKGAMEAVGLEEPFDFYQSSIIHFLTPTHEVFIMVYVLYFLSGIVFGFASESFRDKVKTVSRNAMEDLYRVKRIAVLQVILRSALKPFVKCGLLGIFVAPIFWAIVSPVYVVFLCLYCIPTVYLTFRFLYQSWKVFGVEYEKETYDSWDDKSKLGQRVARAKYKTKSFDKRIHHRRMAGGDAFQQKKVPDGTGLGARLKRICVQVSVGLVSVMVLHGMSLLVVESIGLIIYVMAYTMMGVIVNAAATLRYVSMVVLVFVYMNNCYNNVYQTYQTFNTTIVENIMDRTDDLKQIASLPSSVQENVAFQLKTIDDADAISTTLNLGKKVIRFRVGHLLLFLDSLDTPRIPLNLFKRLCNVRVYGSPGPVYVNLLRATRKFLVIVIFLAFVMIVVMAFGNATGMSNTNQTLATMAGGFVPMLLRNVLSTRSVQVNLKTLSFKGQLDEAIAEYKQNWPVNDMVIEKDEPKAESESEDEGGDENDGKNKDENGDKDKKGDKDKDKKGDKDKDKKGDKDKDKGDKDIKGKFKKRRESGRVEDAAPPPYHAPLYPNSLSPNPSNSTPNGPLQRMRSPSIINLVNIEDNFVDLFVDLSDQTDPNSNVWGSFGASSDSIPSTTMMPNLYKR